MASKLTSVENETRVDHAFGVHDSKGREIGLAVHTSEKTLSPSDDRCGYAMEPGLYFFCYCQATRDGGGYGASQSGSWFKTEAERAAYIAKRLKANEKAAIKKSKEVAQ